MEMAARTSALSGVCRAVLNGQYAALCPAAGADPAIGMSLEHLRSAYAALGPAGELRSGKTGH
eukprot:gene305-4652_t